MSNQDANGNPVTDRPDGWYWVRKISFGLPAGEWEVGKWTAQIRCWSAIDWFGRPDCMVECGSRIERPA